MKKVLAVTIVAAIIGFATLQTANAGWGWGGGRGNGPGDGPGSCGGPCVEGINEEDQKARQEFFDETKDLRQQLFDKRSEYADVLNQENPDKEKAAAIWSEMYDLKKQLKDKAVAAGLGAEKGWNRGDCDGSADCNVRGGRGRGNGRGCNGPRW